MSAWAPPIPRVDPIDWKAVLAQAKTKVRRRFRRPRRPSRWKVAIAVGLAIIATSVIDLITTRSPSQERIANDALWLVIGVMDIAEGLILRSGGRWPMTLSLMRFCMVIVGVVMPT